MPTFNKVVALLAVLTATVQSQSSQSTLITISPYVCCGSPVSTYRNSVMVPYDPSVCNKAGVSGVVLTGNTLSYDDLLNAGKVCTADVTALIAGAPAGMWTIQTTAVMGLVTTPINTGAHTSKPLALGGFVQPVDNACVAPLGAHAPAVFITHVSPTTSNPGSRTRIDFQMASPDKVTNVAASIDGKDDPTSAVVGTDLANIGSVWFTQPASGTHTLGVHVTNSFGCELTRTTDPIIVK